MRVLQHFLVQPSASANAVTFRRGEHKLNLRALISCPFFSTLLGGSKTEGINPLSDDLGWDSISWSAGLIKDRFEGEHVDHQMMSPSSSYHDSKEMAVAEFARTESQENCQNNPFVNGWGNKLSEVRVLLKHVPVIIARCSDLMDSEKAEMYRLHKENPEVYTVKRLARDYQIMKQRVHSILWLKELEEEEKKTLGFHLDNSVKVLLDTCPEFFSYHDTTSSDVPDKPDLRVIPQGWDGRQQQHKESG